MTYFLRTGIRAALALSMLFACLCAGAAEPATPRKIVVGLHESYPWTFSGPGNQAQGMEKEIIEAAFKAQKIDVEFRVMSYSRLITEFQNKRLDFASPVAFDVPGAFFTEKYLPFHDIAVSLKSRGMGIAHVSDLSKKSVVAYQEATKVLGAEYSAIVMAGPYTEMADRGEQIRRLQDLRADVVVGESRISTCLAERLIGPDMISKHAIFPAISYGGAAWDKELVDQFQAGLKLIKQSGQYQKILNRPCPAAL